MNLLIVTTGILPGQTNKQTNKQNKEYRKLHDVQTEFNDLIAVAKKRKKRFTL